MISFTRILCPVDPSEFSVRALRYAAALAAWYRAELTALSVKEATLMPWAGWLDAPLALPPETPEARVAGERAVQAFVASATGTASPRVVFAEGSPAPEILRIAKEMPADLVVIGAHGRGGFERLILGSVTEKVLRKAPCPVLTVPRQAEASTVDADVSFRSIVCAVDFGDTSARALDYALSLAQEAGGRLILVHVLEWLPEELPRTTAHFDVPEFHRTVEHDARARLSAMVPAEAQTWAAAEIVVAHGKAHREILRVASEHGADLVVLGVRGRGVVDRTFFGSTAEHVVRHATCPTLTVGEPGSTS